MQAALTRMIVERAKLENRPYEIRDSRVNGFLVRVQPSGVKSYYCEYGRGKRWCLGRADSMPIGVARDQAKKIISNYHIGIDPMEEKRKQAKAISLKEFLDLYFEPWARVHQKAHVQNIKRIRTVFKMFLKKKLTDLSAIDLERWRAERIGLGNKTSTINRDIASIKAVFNRAVDFEVLEKSPIAKVKKAHEDSSPRVRYLSDFERSSLLRALSEREERRCQERDNANQWRKERNYPLYPDFRKLHFTDYLVPMVIVSLHTGMRRGEVFTLEWDCVDFDAETITIVAEAAKSKKTRHVPINRTCLKALKRWRSQCNKRQKLVFASATGTRFDNVKKSWKALLVSAEITRFRWHDMRHDFASRLAMAGADLNAIRELLGHCDYEMTLRYAHLAPKHKHNAVKLLDEI